MKTYLIDYTKDPGAQFMVVVQAEDKQAAWDKLLIAASNTGDFMPGVDDEQEFIGLRTIREIQFLS